MTTTPDIPTGDLVVLTRPRVYLLWRACSRPLGDAYWATQGLKPWATTDKLHPLVCPS